jgi:hypothetical protein
MREAGAESSRVHPFWRALADPLLAIRPQRGPILAALAAAGILYAPDQIRELYRIAAADRDWGDIALAYAALTLMALCFWWVSFRIVHGLDREPPQTWATAVLLRILPGLIGALPLAACGAGLRAARPAGRDIPPDITSAWAGMAEEIGWQMKSGLEAGAEVLWAIAGVIFVGALVAEWLVRRTRVADSAGGDRAGFFSLRGFLIALALVVGMTVLVIAFPVAFPTALGTLPLVALFFIALILMIGHMTFWHQRTRLPIFMILLIAALASSAFDLNDNHEIAGVTDPAKGIPEEVHFKPAGDSWDNFLAWYKARPNRNRFKTTYPIYIVAAQGGGIYAAYHAATLLARLQDRCPEFRNHVFAISSVSGGSLGAAVFASVTKALFEGGAAQGRGDVPYQPDIDLPCPSMERAESTSLAQVAGPHEQAAAKMLGEDFLAPLVAGTLFPDFTQRFLPFARPEFDRARWLERAFEAAWSRTGLAGPNPFEQSVLRAWSPEGPAPALLINTTESDSGRRVVVSPFTIGDSWEVLNFPLRKYWKGMPRKQCLGREMPLSTAVSLSARFPWMTPAGSLTIQCLASDPEQKRRLVDGGYFDNSGVETALDVIDRIESTLKQNDGRVEGKDGPRVELHLIVLTTSEFPERAGYGMGDALEPVRALLSTRSARTPIAINRAVQHLSAPAPGTTGLDRAGEFRLERVHKARFHNPLYEMPLGWRISKASRDIIDIQNGRFWDCDPDPTSLNRYRQRSSGDFSDADCIQMMVFHQLNETIADELKVLYAIQNWRQRRPAERTPPQRFSHKNFMACYNDALRVESRRAAAVAQKGGGHAATQRSGLHRRQRDALEQILLLWDRNPQFTDERWLAYMLTSVEKASSGLGQREAGCLTEKCTLRGYLARKFQPEANGNRYYGRGLTQLQLPENHRLVAEITGEPVYDHPDLLLDPDVSARVLFAIMTDPRLSPHSTLDKFTTAGEFNFQDAWLTHYLVRERPKDAGKLAQLLEETNPELRSDIQSGVSELKVQHYDRFLACIGAAKSTN